MTLTHLDGHDEALRRYRLEPTMPMVASVDPSTPFTVRTLDSSGDQMREGIRPHDLHRDRLFPIVGPLHVTGVKAGDAVGIEVRRVEVEEVGHTWTREGLGFGLAVPHHVRALNAREPKIDWGSGAAISVTSRPHVGALGVLPATPIEPRDVGLHGGNIDFVNTGPGSVTWLTCQVDGGGVFIADVHAAIGDGEVCGTGIELGATVELVIHHRTDWAPRLPLVSKGQRHWVIGVGQTIEDGLQAGLKECVATLQRTHGLTHADAYLAAGLLLEVNVCQVVNPNRSVAVSMGNGADEGFGPPAPASASGTSAGGG